MSLYWVVYAGLIAFAGMEYLRGRHNKYVYFVSLCVLTLLLCFRFAQGTDYIAYHGIFSAAPTSFTLDHVYYTTDKVHSEVGWKLLNHLFRLMGIGFEGFIFVLSLFQMVMLNRFICKYCPARSLALLLIYPTVYLTYFFSGLRQGLVLAIFVGILLPLLFSGKNIRFCVVAVLSCFFHTSAVLLLLLPIAIRVRMTTYRVLLPCAGVLGMIFSIAIPYLKVLLSHPIINHIVSLFGSVSYYLRDLKSEVSFFALAERLITFGIVAYLYNIYIKHEKNAIVVASMKIYLVGTSFYLLFCWSPLISSRLTYQFKVLEVLLICTMILGSSKFKGIVFAFVIALTCLMVEKNIVSYINQAGYYEQVNAFNYPYISVFEKEKILLLRPLGEDFQLSLAAELKKEAIEWF